MKKYLQGNVVVPWDFSRMSKSALEATLDMVESADKIEVIHVTPYPASTEYGMIWGTFTEVDIGKNLEESFRKEMAEAGMSPDIKFTALFGDPGSRIVEFAKSKEASLIVISSHGHTGLSRIFMGSVAERVVRLSPCPVLVLRGNEGE